MSTLLYVAAILTFLIGIIHSVLGERYILMRLFRRNDLPALFGGPEFTILTLRFAWHITTIAWWGFAAILLLMATESLSFQNTAIVLSVTFLATGLTALLASRGKHLSWIIFLTIGSICLYGVINQAANLD